jgi:hypothetical protein
MNRRVGSCRPIDVALLLALLLSAGCGSDGGGANPATDQGGHSSGGDGSGGASGTGGASGGGGSGTAGDAGTGGGATQPVGCIGDFGAPELVLSATTRKLGSVSVTADELELFYVEQSGLGMPEVYKSSRRGSINEQFVAGVPIAELNEQCAEPNRSIDVTDDGLRAYIGCAADALGPETIYVAERANRTAPFQVRSGAVATSGRGWSIGGNELTAVSSGVPFGEPPLLFTRSAITATFGAGSGIPGLSDVAWSSPDVSNDGLSLFAAAAGELVTAKRSATDQPFATGSALPFPSSTYGSPNITRDCRSLYYLEVSEDLSVWHVQVRRR